MSIFSKTSLKQAFAPAVLTALLTTTGCANTGLSPNTVFGEDAGYNQQRTRVFNQQGRCDFYEDRNKTTVIDNNAQPQTRTIIEERTSCSTEQDNRGGYNRRSNNRFEQVQDRSLDTMQNEIQRGISNGIREFMRGIMP